MTPISLGILASSGAGGAKIEATGGTIIDQNGYRHHVFTVSGTFTVNSGQGTAFYLEQDGGNDGSIGSTSRAGGGGSGGIARASYVTGFPVSAGESITVTVGARGSRTTVVTSKPKDQEAEAYGGQGATSSISAGDGEQGTSLANMTNNIITQISISNPIAHTGGGGGGGGYFIEYFDEPRPTINQDAGLGGLTGGVNGSFWSNGSGRFVNQGLSAAANTGGGGGGAGVSIESDEGLDLFRARQSRGGSGYAIISYPL